MAFGWTWANGTPRERAQMVRSHANGCRPLPTENLCTLFNLTKDGLYKILDGYDWKPEFEAWPDGSSQPLK